MPGLGLAARSVMRLPTPTPRLAGVLQGSYYLLTGVWPLISIRTFERVSGPKSENWLAKTVGVLIAVVGAELIGRGLRGRPPEGVSLGLSSAASLAAVDLNYVLRRRIPAIYLLDALAESAIILIWVLSLRRRPAVAGGVSGTAAA